MGERSQFGGSIRRREREKNSSYSTRLIKGIEARQCNKIHVTVNNVHVTNKRAKGRVHPTIDQETGSRTQRRGIEGKAG